MTQLQLLDSLRDPEAVKVGNRAGDEITARQPREFVRLLASGDWCGVEEVYALFITQPTARIAGMKAAGYEVQRRYRKRYGSSGEYRYRATDIRLLGRHDYGFNVAVTDPADGTDSPLLKNQRHYARHFARDEGLSLA